MNRRLIQGVQLLALAVGAGVGLAWALPAAGIGLLLGLIGLYYHAHRLLPWLYAVLAGREERRPVPPSTTALVLQLSWVAGVVASCAIVAGIGARGGLNGHGLEFIPAIIPYLLVPFALPSVLRFGAVHGEAGGSGTGVDADEPDRAASR